MDMKRFHIWTDGSCKVHSSKVGSWAYLIVDDNDELLHSDSGYREDTTSPAMELMAVVQGVGYALNKLPHGEIVVHSDSEVVIKGITDWIYGWKERNWRTSNGKSVRNKTLWKHLDHLTDVVDVEFKWVKGHDGIKWNEEAHNLAELEQERYEHRQRNKTD